VANWNLEWAPTRSPRADTIRQYLFAAGADIACLTEAYSGFLPDGHAIEADSDYGYPLVEGRRKVILWSRRPWSDVSRGEQLDFPGGRLVDGLTDTPIGPLRVVGVCVTWRDAHVLTGRRDRAVWQDHVSFLRALRGHLKESTTRTVVVGDFNQRLPRGSMPSECASVRAPSAMPVLAVGTAGLRDEAGNAAIDHLALTRDLTAGPATVLPAVASDGSRLSDHFGFGLAVSPVH
jgi:hypothetical protein